MVSGGFVRSGGMPKGVGVRGVDSPSNVGRLSGVMGMLEVDTPLVRGGRDMDRRRSRDGCSLSREGIALGGESVAISTCTGDGFGTPASSCRRAIYLRSVGRRSSS